MRMTFKPFTHYIPFSQLLRIVNFQCCELRNRLNFALQLPNRDHML